MLLHISRLALLRRRAPVESRADLRQIECEHNTVQCDMIAISKVFNVQSKNGQIDS